MSSDNVEKKIARRKTQQQLVDTGENAYNKAMRQESPIFSGKEKSCRFERLSLAEGEALYRSSEILEIGRWADEVNRARNAHKVYYSINRHINYTNICVCRCAFCGFSRRADQPGAYVLSVEEVLERAAQAQQAGATEVHIVGGIHPDLEYDYYRRMIAGIHQAFPALHIKAFTASEIIDLAVKAGRPVEAVLEDLMAAGLGSLPGGGAEILDEGYFAQFAPQKSSPEQWLSVHATAHRLGLMTNATMLFGYRETLEQRIGHLLKIRQLQDQSLQVGKGSFQCFVPLPYISGDTGEKVCAEGFLELKTIAISRLMLDNVPHIKAFWPMLGVGLAQVALAFGADDLEGTVQRYEVVTPAGGGRGKAELTESQLQNLIRQTGREPVRRDDGRYLV